MTSATSDPSIGSLSESWATLSNASDVRSEDDWPSEPADNISLIGHSTGDDVTSLDGQDLDSDVDTDDTESRCSESQVLLPPTFPETEDLHENEQDDQASFTSTSNSIVFDEPVDWTSTKVVDLKRTLQILDGSEATYIGYPFDLKERDLILSLQQSIIQDAINVDQPFRILYVGNPEFKHKILDKLGDVLVASPSSSLYAGSANLSRFHVVPASFGPDATPTYAELLPLHVQLTVEECNSAEISSGPGIQGEISLFLNDGEAVTSTRTAFGCQLQSNFDWIKPDIAILFIGANDDGKTCNTRNLALQLLRRHGIPSMMVSEMPLWTSNCTFPVDPRTLHICLESRDPKTGISAVIGRFPIDIGTFENIAPAQLNRNLAALTGAHHKPETKEGLSAKQANNGYDTRVEVRGTDSSSYFCPKDEQSRVLAKAIGAVLLILCCTGPMVFLIVKMMMGFVDVSLNGNFSAGSDLKLVPSVSMTPAETPLLPKQDVVALSHSIKEKSLSVSDDILKLSNPADQRPNTTDRFQVYILGDCHVIIKVPSRVSTKRRSPKFEVAVTKEDSQMHFHLSKLFDDVYTLRLAREDAHGVMNVTISSTTKPPMKQVTEVDFGTPWLKIANWKKAARSLSYQLRKDLSAAQTGLSEAYHRVSFDLQAVSYALRGEAGITCHESIRHISKTADRLMFKSRRFLRQLGEDTAKRLMISSRNAHKQAQSLDRSLMSFANKLWYATQQHANGAQQSVKQVLSTQFTQKAKKSQTLAAAQNQAFHLAKDSRIQWKLPMFLRTRNAGDNAEKRRN